MSQIEIKFVIPGIPVAKARPRFVNMGKFVRSYTPEKTVNFEILVKSEFYQVHKLPPSSLQVEVEVLAFFPIPKGWNQKKTAEAVADTRIPVLKKPDVDNVLKSICDGLNGIAYEDDKQVFRASIGKYYSNHPRTEVKLIFGKEEVFF